MTTINDSNSGLGIRVEHRRQKLLEGNNTGPFFLHAPIGTLHDGVLLEVFYFYVVELQDRNDDDGWHTLVHVCRRWRNVVFASPRRLNLQLLCTYRRPVREKLNIWPELPIIVLEHRKITAKLPLADNVMAALELNHRASQILLWHLSSSALESIAAVMQVPFPVLTKLTLGLHSADDTMVLPNSFLDGFAPRLQSLWLKSISFPTLPRLLLSSTDLVDLSLWEIPHSGYLSPKLMVTCLSTLTRLGTLALTFRSPLSRPPRASRRPPPLMRTVLPALTQLHFKGATEYLEELVSRIDVPSLAFITITFFNQLVFVISQLPKFLCRAETLPDFDQAVLTFRAHYIEIILFLSETPTIDFPLLKFEVSCSRLDWQLSSLPQVCGSCLLTLSNLKRLDIREAQDSSPDWQDDIENIQWLEIFHPFTMVKDVHLYDDIASRVAPTLQELAAGQVTEVLPSLQNLYIVRSQPSGSVQEVIAQFVSARQLSGHPVASHRLERGNIML